MINANEHLVILSEHAVKASQELSQATLTGLGNLAAAQLAISKEILADSVDLAKQYSQVKDVQALVALNTKVAEPSLQKVMGYYRSLYEVAATTQGDLSSIIEDYIGEVNKAVVVGLDKAAKAAPAGAGADAAVAAVKSALVASTTAYDSMSKAAKQVANFAEASITAATSKAVAGVAKKKMAA